MIRVSEVYGSGSNWDRRNRENMRNGRKSVKDKRKDKSSFSNLLKSSMTDIDLKC